MERLKATDDLIVDTRTRTGETRRNADASGNRQRIRRVQSRRLPRWQEDRFCRASDPHSLAKFHLRAKLLSTKDAKPVLRAPVQFPGHDRELFFDIEVDPMRDICYLHGFVERRGRDNGTEKFVAFFADECTPASERAAFAAAWAYMRENRPCAIYYYSKYERTIYRKLQQKYPDVCSAEDIEELFDPAHAIDLYYDVVKKATEWPTWDFSIKTLAKYLGFAWRDTHPSGAASIEWFDRWIKTGDRRSGSVFLTTTRTTAARRACCWTAFGTYNSGLYTIFKRGVQLLRDTTSVRDFIALLRATYILHRAYSVEENCVLSHAMTIALSHSNPFRLMDGAYHATWGHGLGMRAPTRDLRIALLRRGKLCQPDSIIELPSVIDSNSIEPVDSRLD